MSAFDFRRFLEQQDKNGELLRVKSEVDTLDDVGAFISRLDYSGIKKSILFENPKDFDIPVYHQPGRFPFDTAGPQPVLPSIRSDPQGRRIYLDISGYRRCPEYAGLLGFDD